MDNVAGHDLTFFGFDAIHHHLIPLKAMMCSPCFAEVNKSISVFFSDDGTDNATHRRRANTRLEVCLGTL